MLRRETFAALGLGLLSPTVLEQAPSLRFALFCSQPYTGGYAYWCPKTHKIDECCDNDIRPISEMTRPNKYDILIVDEIDGQLKYLGILPRNSSLVPQTIRDQFEKHIVCREAIVEAKRQLMLAQSKERILAFAEKFPCIRGCSKFLNDTQNFDYLYLGYFVVHTNKFYDADFTRRLFAIAPDWKLKLLGSPNRKPRITANSW